MGFNFTREEQKLPKTGKSSYIFNYVIVLFVLGADMLNNDLKAKACSHFYFSRSDNPDISA